MTVLAIDQGTTSTRILAVDAEGGCAVLRALPHRQIYPRPGWVEHDPAELIANIATCLDAAVRLPDITCVGISNQGESCLAWDAVSGAALSPVLVWQDDRTAPEIARLKADGAETLTLARAQLPLDPYFSGAKLGWLMRHVPEVAEAARRRRLRLGTTDAYFRQHLTGICATDPATASRTSLMDLDTCAWSAELCTLFGVPMEALPPILPTTGGLGTARIGARDIPLTASIVDQQAAVMGHGCTRPGDGKITLGTGAFALVLTDAGAVAAAGPLPTIAWQLDGEAPVRALDGGVYAAASAVNWARGLGLFKDWSDIDSFEAAPAVSRGLTFVPALSGLACPHWDRAARGSWMGLSLDTTPRDMVQAVLEGVAFRMAEVMQAVERTVTVRAPISIDGGMSRNPWFCQILADTLAREVLVSDEAELTALGTAALAASGAGAPFTVSRKGRVVQPQSRPANWSDTFAAARTAVQTYGQSAA